MACDMCGKKGTSLESIRDCYATNDIKSICSDCNRLVTDKMWKIRAVTDGILKTAIKRFMCNFNKGE